MTIINSYLSELFGKKKKEEKVIPTETLLKSSGFDIVNSDRGLPNPFNFKKLKLDKVNPQDLKNADIEWKKSIEKGYIPSKETISEVYKRYIMATIVDGSKRVGILAWDPDMGLLYVTWIPGKNYATAGAMKFLNDKRYFDQIVIYHDNRVTSGNFHILIHKDNKASIKVAKNLKPTKQIIKQNHNVYFFDAPFWWNKNKFLNHVFRY